MEFSKFKLNDQRSSRSSIFFKKKWTLANNQKKVVVSILTSLMKSFDYFLFKWKFFSIQFQKNFFFLKKLKNNRSTIMLFLNIPFLISCLILEIFESIRKKTIYLYRFILLCSIPLLIFSVNKNLILTENKKDYLSFFLSENNKTIFEEKSSFYIKKLQEKLLEENILNLLSKKVQDSFSQKNTSFLVDKNVKSFSSNLKFVFRNSQNWKKEKGYNYKKSVIFSKWFSLYKKIKKHYSSELQGFSDLNEKNLTGFWIAKFHDDGNYLKFNKLSTFVPLDFYRIKKDSFTKQQFVQQISNFFFSLIKSKDLKFLNHFSLKLALNKRSLLLENLQSEFLANQFIDLVEKNTPYKQQQLKNLENVNKRQWITTIKEWIEFYPSEENLLSVSKNKQFLKQNVQLFREFQFLIYFFQKNVEVYFRKLLLNKINVSLFFLNKNQSFIFRSYKKALNLETTNIENSLNSEFFPFCIKKVKDKSLNEKINFLYHFSFPVDQQIHFMTPELLFLLDKTGNMPVQVFQDGKVEKENLPDFFQSKKKIQDLFFCFKYSTLTDNFSWFSFQKNILKLKESTQNEKTILSHPILNSRALEDDVNFMRKQREFSKKNLTANKNKLMKNYTNWFFTPQWWLFQKQRLFIENQFLLEDVINKAQIFFNTFYSNRNFLEKNNLGFDRSLNKVSNKIINLFEEWNILFIEKIYKVPHQKSLWTNVHFLPLINNNSWSFFSWFISSSIIYYHWLPMFTGIIFFYLWLDFEKIRSLSYPSWQTDLNILTHTSFDSPAQRLRLAGYLSKGKIFFIYSKIYSLYNKIFFIFNKLNYIRTVDLSKRNKNLISNSLITSKTLQSKYSFWNINEEDSNSLTKIYQDLNGFNFFQKWSKKKYRLSNFLQKKRFTSFSLNWLTNLLIYNKNFIKSFRLLNNRNYVNHTSRPTSLLEPFSYTQRWLFIGSIESGKSFIIKSIASNTHYPLIHFSIKTIKNATPDNKYNRVQKEKRWVEQLSERSFLLDNIFKLTKILAPSFFWISDLHDFETKNQIQEKVQNFDISLLMANLLKILSVDLVPEEQNQITFIGSTEYPRLLDPKFISRQRLDFIINFRTPSLDQKQNIFTSFLNNKGFHIKGLGFSYGLDFNTLGYTFRDITSLINETLLIKTTENTKVIDSNTVRLALYRQTSTQSVKYTTIIQENLQYKIGKAVVQAILLAPKSILFLSKYSDLWKTKFYYLSNTYLDTSSKKAVTTEFVLFTQLLNCLSGSAARDAWTLSKTELTGTKLKVSQTLALTSPLKHDFFMASSILQSLLIEFPLQEITSLSQKKKKDPQDLLHTFSFHFLKRALSSLEFFDQFPSYINWSIKGKRISFNWILFFSGIEHSSTNFTRFMFSKKTNKDAYASLFEKNLDLNSPYERRETKRQQQKIQKIDSFFIKLISILYIEKFGFPWESKYIMEYNPFQFSFFFREARPLWNPRTIMPSYSLFFFDRDLLINQNLLTKLYLTYGNKFQLEKLNRKRIKKQFFWSNFSSQKLDANKTSEGKKDFRNSQVLPSGTSWTDFHSYETFIHLNAQLEQSQIQLPVYLHQSWITADPNESLKTFNNISIKNELNNQDFISKESILFEFLLEIYNYLVTFFLENRSLMNQIKDVFVKNGVLHRQDIQNAIKKHFSN